MLLFCCRQFNDGDNNSHKVNMKIIIIIIIIIITTTIIGNRCSSIIIIVVIIIIIILLLFGLNVYSFDLSDITAFIQMNLLQGLDSLLRKPNKRCINFSVLIYGK